MHGSFFDHFVWVTIGIDVEFSSIVVLDCAVDERRTSHLLPPAKRNRHPNARLHPQAKLKTHLRKGRKCGGSILSYSQDHHEKTDKKTDEKNHVPTASSMSPLMGAMRSGVRVKLDTLHRMF
jgi:hypothetical protein